MVNVTLSGPVSTWKLNEAERKYIVTTIPFKLARQIFKPNLYMANTGEGEQRQIFPSHANSIRKDMLVDRYTPMPVVAGLNDELSQNLTESPDGSTFILKVTNSLPLIDGGHRFEALDKLIEQGNKDALEVPITAVIFLDNRNKENFLNAQKGRAVDKAHMLSLQVSAELNNSKIGPFLHTALEIAKILNDNENSPFYKFVQFDSRKGIGLLPISTLSAKGSSDLGTSLVGTAKIAQSVGKDANWGATAIIDAFQTVKNNAKHLLEVGRPLTPPPGGSRGSATMWIGVGNLFAYRQTLPDAASSDFVEAIKKCCNHAVHGNFSGPKKRELLGEIAYNSFNKVSTVPFYNDEIPQGLIDALSYSTFAIKKPKTKKKNGRLKKMKVVDTGGVVAYEMPGIKKLPEKNVIVVEDNTELAPWEEEVQA